MWLAVSKRPPGSSGASSLCRTIARARRQSRSIFQASTGEFTYKSAGVARPWSFTSPGCLNGLMRAHDAAAMRRQDSAFQTCPEVRERQHLDCGLRPDLDGAAARYAEILARVVSSASQPDEKPPPPARHLRFRRRPQGPSGEEEGGAHHVEGHALGTGSNERPRHVRLLHKSEAKGHTGK